ncbi:DUF1571 domain-containing protein [Paraburkholderia mimosarum]|uniref:DUF1571 domain-containing protein n=1 Tax=Paraburkholderia mimosarum TaxID=312026 RepID=UPI000400115A|nr:DUF1571 domain-containing protein [Paraburkholderia mimosarum]
MTFCLMRFLTRSRFSPRMQTRAGIVDRGVHRSVDCFVVRLVVCLVTLFGLLTLTVAGANEAGVEAPPSRAGSLAPNAQVRWLQRAARDGTLARLDDAQLVALFTALNPDTLARYIAAGPNGYASCQFVMRHRERIDGRWPATADHLLVRVAHDPLRLYARWLPDGAHAGQEVLYDAAHRSDEMYGHAGGLLGAVSMWTQLDGAFARSQSHHRLTELGTEPIAQHFLDNYARLSAAGAGRPSRIAVETRDGVRVVTFTWQAPPGAQGLPASRETLGLDLRHPWFRTVQSYDGEGRLVEDIVIERIEPQTFDALTFDARNPDYRF